MISRKNCCIVSAFACRPALRGRSKPRGHRVVTRGNGWHPMRVAYRSSSFEMSIVWSRADSVYSLSSFEFACPRYGTREYSTVLRRRARFSSLPYQAIRCTAYGLESLLLGRRRRSCEARHVEKVSQEQGRRLFTAESRDVRCVKELHHLWWYRDTDQRRHLLTVTVSLPSYAENSPGPWVLLPCERQAGLALPVSQSPMFSKSKIML